MILSCDEESHLNKAIALVQLAATFLSELARPVGVLSPENMTGGASSRHVVPQELLEYLTERYSGRNI